jgi:eukaryotic-like serine/threonine-protein kinase
MNGWGDFFGRLIGKGQRPNGQGKLAPGKSGKLAKDPGAPARRQLRSNEFYQPGDVIGGKYEIRHLVGKGGFGLVYAAYNRQTREVVAIKTFRDEFLVDAHARKMFQKEALLWVNLEAHPFIVAARWVQEFSGRLFVEMDYIAPDGQGRASLQDHLATCSLHLPWELTVEWANEFCLGMEHAKAHGIKCHRDIKPANILITQNGVLKITDFGLAAVDTVWRGRKSLVSRHADGRLGYSLLATEGKMWCGTPGYIAPEVYEGKGADVRSEEHTSELQSRRKPCFG